MDSWQKIFEAQQEVMQSAFQKITENTKGLNPTELAKKMANPFEAFVAMAKGTEGAYVKSKELMDNNIKYHKAFVAYQEAMRDMMDAVAANAKFLSGEK
jgi:hypothetical protein